MKSVHSVVVCVFQIDVFFLGLTLIRNKFLLEYILLCEFSLLSWAYIEVL